MAGLTQYQNTGRSQFTTGLLVIIQTYNLPEKGNLPLRYDVPTVGDCIHMTILWVLGYIYSCLCLAVT